MEKICAESNSDLLNSAQIRKCSQHKLQTPYKLSTQITNTLQITSTLQKFVFIAILIGLIEIQRTRNALNTNFVRYIQF